MFAQRLVRSSHGLNCVFNKCSKISIVCGQRDHSSCCGPNNNHGHVLKPGHVASVDFRSFNSSEESPMKRLISQNREFVSKTIQTEPEFFSALAHGQKPEYLYFGCSDARIAANSLLGLKPGEVFVHRNLGNQCPVNDMNSLSVLEYAVNGLNIKNIIVGGHYNCGAVMAAMTNKHHGHIMENWFRMIRDVYRYHMEEINSIQDPVQQHRKLVELNVVEQCLNLYKTNIVQLKRKETYENPKIGVAYPRIYGIVFDPATGLMEQLPINFKDILGKYRHIYDLYDVDSKKV